MFAPSTEPWGALASAQGTLGRGDTSPHVPWSASAGGRALWRSKMMKHFERAKESLRSNAQCVRGRRRARRSARGVRGVMLALALCGVGAVSVWGGWRRRHAMRPGRMDRVPLEARRVEDVGVVEGELGSGAMMLSCGALDAEVGGFKGVVRRFRPTRVRSGKSLFSWPGAAKTAVLTGVNADAADAKASLEAFLTHYLDFGKIPAKNVFVVVHDRLGKEESNAKVLEALLIERGVTYDVYVGSKLLHSELSTFWQRHLDGGKLDEEDWVILADLDEHLTVPPREDLGSEGHSIPLFLAQADELGYEVVNGIWIDRVTSDGSLTEANGQSLHKQFPKKCQVGPECDLRRKPPRGTAPHHERMVIAHKLKFAIRDVRSLHDFAIDDFARPKPLTVAQKRVFPVPVAVQHFQWTAGTEDRLRGLAESYEACGLKDANVALTELASSLERANHKMTTKTCPSLSCDDTLADNGNSSIRRIAIVTTVWEHVDGVSRTMKRFSEYLRGRGDTSVLVMSPDLAEQDYLRANVDDDIHELVAPVPAIEVPGRPEYKFAPPLRAQQRVVLSAYRPHVVHVAAPDMLGHSAVHWAAEVGVCSVCSYHTAFDTYMQYYHASVLSHPIEHLLKDFYGKCDVVAVPTYAAAAHLRKLGVPGERMGFFPRGVNQTLYSPKMRDSKYRKEMFGADDDEIIILWVARIVREKGLQSFMNTVKALNRAAAKEPDLPKFRVVIAGDGPDLGWVRGTLSQYSNVVILGHKGGANLAKTYAAGDIFFFPSKTEVIPNNLIEAMASGLPVVTDDVGVNRAIVQDGVSGIIVKHTAVIPRDVSNYVHALKRLMKDKTLAKRMSQAAVESTVGLTWERTFESLLHAYDRCRPGLPYARHIPREKLDEPKAYPRTYEPTETTRDVIVDDGAPSYSLLYRISRGITGGYVRSLEDAKRDDEVFAKDGSFA